MNTLPTDPVRSSRQSEIAVAIATSLLKINALTVSPDEPFTWASGLRSPLYCDNRISLGYPLVRRQIRDAFEQVLSDWIQDASLIVGTATAGIPHAAWLADVCELPLAYVRASAKSHGKQNKVEGYVPDGSTALIIEDLVSTGGSAIAAADAMKEAGAEVVGVGCIFSYRLDEAKAAFASGGLEYRALTDLDAVLGAAKAEGILTDRQVQSVLEWRNNPAAWAPGVV